MRIKEEEVSKQSRQMTDGHSRRVPTPPDPWAIQIKLEAWASAAHTARMGVTQVPGSRLRLALALGALGARGGTENSRCLDRERSLPGLCRCLPVSAKYALRVVAVVAKQGLTG